MGMGDGMLTLARAAAADRALGVFETMLVRDGAVAAAPRHLARLAGSVHELYGEALPEDIHARLLQAAAGRALARLRVDVVPGSAPALAVTEIEAELVLPEAPRELVEIEVEAGFGAHKLADRAWLEEAEALAGEGVAALLVTRAGALLETTRANVFLVRDGVLATPPLEGGILPGVTRALLLERARRAGVPALELPLTRADMDAADAVLLTSSLRLLERSRVRAAQRSLEVVELLREALREAA